MIVLSFWLFLVFLHCLFYQYLIDVKQYKMFGLSYDKLVVFDALIVFMFALVFPITNMYIIFNRSKLKEKIDLNEIKVGEINESINKKMMQGVKKEMRLIFTKESDNTDNNGVEYWDGDPTTRIQYEVNNIELLSDIVQEFSFFLKSCGFIFDEIEVVNFPSEKDLSTKSCCIDDDSNDLDDSDDSDDPDKEE